MPKPGYVFKNILALLVGIALLAGLHLTSWYNYLLFHALAEGFSIIVAYSLFMVAWHSRLFIENNYLKFLGIAFLFVGSLDALHTLAYKGMNVFPGYDANLPTQLWIAARYLQSLALLIAPLFLRRKLRIQAVFAAAATIFVLLLITIFSGRFPDCYIEGSGLTFFKIFSEYGIVSFLIAAITALYRNRRYFEDDVLMLLMTAIVVTIGSEISFTLYLSVYGISNLIGHLLKIIAFFCVYRAIIITGLEKPYSFMFRNLVQHKETLQETNARLQQEIVIRERTEAALREREEQYRQMFVKHRAVKLLIDPETGAIVDANPAAAEFYGYSPETLATMKITEINTLPAQVIKTEIEQALGEQRNHFFFQHRLASGEIREVEVYAVPIDVSGKRLLYSIIHDITDRKRMEEQIKASLREKEALLQEIHHRVKNNIQSITSMIRLQYRQIQDDAAGVLLKELENRIRSMAIIHEMLYQSDNLVKIDLNVYFRKLLTHLWRSYGVSAEKIAPNIAVEDVSFGIETAIPLGLLTNELASNTLKHAFPEERTGELRISLRPLGDAGYELVVSDNGVGLPEGFDLEQTTTLGLTLVRSWVNQLQGELEIDPTTGVCFRIAFQELKYKGSF